MPKAYSYVRFSTAEQSKGDSVRRQTELSEKYARNHGLELDKRINMRDLGISAYDRSNITKGALGQFLQLVNEGRIEPGSYLLVESFDRLSRDKVMDALSVFMDILRAGIIVVTLADEQVYSYSDANSMPFKLIMSILVMSRANEESATKSRRNRAAWDNKRATISEKRLTARCPYWLRPTENKQGFELIPERVAVVKRIYQMSKDGLGVTTIVKTLNEEKVANFSDKTDGWQNSYVQKILSSKAVYGELQLSLQRDGERTALDTVPDYYPSIMTKDDWLLISSIRSGRRTRGGVSKGAHLSNLFSGLLRCGYCGSPMNMGGYVNKRANGETREGKYVACSHARRGMGCIYAQWNYSHLERNILWFCTSVDYASILQNGSVNSQTLENAEARILAINNEIQTQQNKLNQLLEAVEGGESDSQPKIIIQRMLDMEGVLDVLAQDKIAAEKEAARLRNEVAQQSNYFKMINDVYSQLDQLEGSDLRYFRVRLSELLKHDIHRIDLYPAGNWQPEDKFQEHLSKVKAMGADADVLATLENDHRNPCKDARTFHVYFHNGTSKVVVPVLNREVSMPAI